MRHWKRQRHFHPGTQLKHVVRVNGMRTSLAFPVPHTKDAAALDSLSMPHVSLNRFSQLWMLNRLDKEYRSRRTREHIKKDGWTSSYPTTIILLDFRLYKSCCFFRRPTLIPQRQSFCCVRVSETECSTWKHMLLCRCKPTQGGSSTNETTFLPHRK